jgi:intracellular multiplication protein IcmC
MNIRLLLGYLILLSLFITSSALAQTSTVEVSSLSAADMLVNFAKNVPNLLRFVTAVAYVMGMYFTFIGIMKLKHLGESRTMMSQDHSFSEPAMYLLAGALLLYLPTSIQVGMSTFWTDPNPYGYLQEAGQWEQFYNVCFTVVQLFGVIAFIRGVVILAHTGSGRGGHQGGIGKALTHIIGGIFCINIYQFVMVVLATLGIS